MAMTLRLNAQETDALRRKAQDEGRSMQEVAKDAVNSYTGGRTERVQELIERGFTEHAELLARLAR